MVVRILDIVVRMWPAEANNCASCMTVYLSAIHGSMGFTTPSRARYQRRIIARVDHATAERIEAATSRLQAANDRFSRLLVQEGLTLTVAQVSEIKQQIAFANVLSAKRGLSWARLLSDLEEATPAEISYSSVQMNFKEATVALEGATSSLQGLNALVMGLNRHPAFSKATLSSHVLEAAKDSKSEGGMSDLSLGLPAVKHVLFHMTAAYSPTS